MQAGGVGRLQQLAGVAALLLIGVVAVRSALVEAWASTRPALATAAWPGHPDALLSSALTAIAQAAAEGKTPAPSILGQVARAARSAPLAPEPLLVSGTHQLSLRRFARAAALLAEARRRDPRALAPRLLLIDLQLRQGRVEEGVQEIGALSRLLPGGPAPVVATLAAYAREPASQKPLAALFLRRPDLRDPVLSILASDPQMAPRALALAGPGVSGSRWQAVLVDALVRAGRYAEARAAWTRFTGDKTARDRLVNASFTPRAHPIPPFDWSYAQAGGTAEPSADGLRALGYGRTEAPLASQTLLLPPGTYRLGSQSDRASGAPAGLVWTIGCVPRELELVRLPLPARPGPAGSSFKVPSDCPAQRLALLAAENAFAIPTQATFRALRIEKK